MAKSIIKLAARKIGWYPSIHSSQFYDIYIYFFHQKHWMSLQKQTKLLKRLLAQFHEQLMIFDIGANVGQKADIFRRVASKIVCAEPDSCNVIQLQERFKRYHNIIIVPKAISQIEGEEKFYIHNAGSAYNTLSPKWKSILEDSSKSRFETQFSFQKEYFVDVTTLDKLIQIYGIPQYIKLDIEGYEINALKGLTHSIPFISFEANLPEFKGETIECLDIMHYLSPDIHFAYSINEGGENLELTRWLNYEQFRILVIESNLRFMEILAVSNTQLINGIKDNKY